MGRYGHFIYGSWEPFVACVTVSADSQPSEHRRSMVRLKLDQPADGIHGIEAVQSKVRGALDRTGCQVITCRNS